MLRLEMEDLRTKLQSFDNQIYTTFIQLGQHVEQKFKEFSQSDFLMESVLTKVIEGVREKFDAQGELRTRFESVVDGLSMYDRKLSEMQLAIDSLTTSMDRTSQAM